MWTEVRYEAEDDVRQIDVLAHHVTAPSQPLARRAVERDRHTS
jgi:hypothetical protein